MTPGIYLFCLARARGLPPHLEGTGLDGISPLQVTVFNELAAIWSPVAMEAFCGPEAEDRLRELTWIGPRVIRHQEAVVRIMRYSPVLPARFGTIFSSLARLEKLVQQHHDTVAGFLGRCAGQEEWSVKGMLDRDGAREKFVARTLACAARRLETLPPGRRYFEEQRLRGESDRDLQSWLQEVCRRLWTDLREDAGDMRQRRVLSRQATGSDREMVLNWAFLVARDDVAGFRSRIQEANARYGDCGLVLECRGPWPPYSFCPALDQEPEA